MDDDRFGGWFELNWHSVCVVKHVENRIRHVRLDCQRPAEQRRGAEESPQTKMCVFASFHSMWKIYVCVCMSHKKNKFTHTHTQVQIETQSNCKCICCCTKWLRQPMLHAFMLGFGYKHKTHRAPSRFEKQRKRSLCARGGIFLVLILCILCFGFWGVLYIFVASSLDWGYVWCGYAESCVSLQMWEHQTISGVWRVKCVSG